MGVVPELTSASELFPSRELSGNSPKLSNLKAIRFILTQILKSRINQIQSRINTNNAKAIENKNPIIESRLQKKPYPCCTIRLSIILG